MPETASTLNSCRTAQQGDKAQGAALALRLERVALVEPAGLLWPWAVQALEHRAAEGLAHKGAEGLGCVSSEAVACKMDSLHKSWQVSNGTRAAAQGIHWHLPFAAISESHPGKASFTSFCECDYLWADPEPLGFIANLSDDPRAQFSSPYSPILSQD